MEAKVYNQSGAEVGKLTLPESVFGLPWNADLVHMTVEVLRGNLRSPIAHAKDRSEVRGGGKKPWKQKGTGRARHGSSRSPIWVGGGVTHGPSNETIYYRKINKKARSKAWATVVSKKLRDGEVIFMDAIDLGGAKTKIATGILSTLSRKLDKKELAYKKGSRVLIALNKRDANVEKAFRNLKSVKVEECRNLNALTSISYKYIIFVDYHAK